jgi:predicted alpha/beta superfamily hydrolase
MIEKDIVLGKRVKIHSEILGEERTLFIRLPPGYEESQVKYPVLYQLDGEFESLLTNAVSSIEYPRDDESDLRMILVAVANTDRSRDMFPVRVSKSPTSGGASRFLRFMVEELKPLVDRSYRTSGYDVLYGASNSGLYVLYSLLSRPDSFVAYIASSPMIGWCREFIFELAERRFSESESLDKCLYMICGTDDESFVTSHVADFARLIEAKAPDDFRWELKVVEEGGHVPFTSLYDGLNAITDHARARIEKTPRNHSSSFSRKF